VPTYDYQCRSCGFITEVVHSMFEDGPTTCARCGGELRRVFHPTGIIFKGGGFYKTDSRAPSSSSAGGSSRDGSGSGGSGDASAPAASTTETKTSETGSTPTSSGGAAKGAKGEGGAD
jgi:putative FmdB family regulatory protein